jgi:hypothetical protein
MEINMSKLMVTQIKDLYKIADRLERTTNIFVVTDLITEIPDLLRDAANNIATELNIEEKVRNELME